MKYKFKGRVEKGKLKLSEPHFFNKTLLTYEGKDINIIIQRYKVIRSTDQNRLYWWYLTFIGNELGYEAEELHGTFKAMFLVDRSGKLPIVQSTTRLSTMEFSEYIERIIRAMAKLNIVLPEPNSVAIN